MPTWRWAWFAYIAIDIKYLVELHLLLCKCGGAQEEQHEGGDSTGRHVDLVIIATGAVVKLLSREEKK